MKILLIIILFTLNIFAASSADRGLSSMRLTEIDIDPEELLLKTDSMESAGEIPLYKIDYLRTFAYFSLNKYSKCISYADKVLNSSLSKKDTLIMENTIILKAESGLLLNNLIESAYFLRDVMKFNKKYGSSVLSGNISFLQGILQRRMNLNEESYISINKAVSILSKESGYNTYLRIFMILGVLTDYYIQDGRMESALAMSKERKKILDRLKDKDIPSRIMDMQRGYLYGDMAYLSFLLNRLSVAEDYYERFMQTSFSSTLNGKRKINPYLLAVGQYNKVIENNKQLFLDIDIEDTSSSMYLRALLQSAKAYKGINDYEWAYLTLEKYNSIVVDIRREADRHHLIEISDEVEYLRYASQLNKAEQNLASRSRMLYVVSAFLLILMAAIMWIYLDRRALRLKNKKITDLMLRFNENRQSSGNFPASPDGVRSRAGRKSTCVAG